MRGDEWELAAGAEAQLADEFRARALAAEAQVEALTEALREIAATDPSDCDWRDVAQTYERIAREALSRVSRSEPAPPNALLYDAWGVIANVSEGDWEKQPQVWQDAAKRWRDRWHAFLAAAPPVPEEQQ